MDSRNRKSTRIKKEQFATKTVFLFERRKIRIQISPNDNYKGKNITFVKKIAITVKNSKFLFFFTLSQKKHRTFFNNISLFFFLLKFCINYRRAYSIHVDESFMLFIFYENKCLKRFSFFFSLNFKSIVRRNCSICDMHLYHLMRSFVVVIVNTKILFEKKKCSKKKMSRNYCCCSCSCCWCCYCCCCGCLIVMDFHSFWEYLFLFDDWLIDLLFFCSFVIVVKYTHWNQYWTEPLRRLESDISSNGFASFIISLPKKIPKKNFIS